jgi:hypothetical protein
LWCAPNKTHSKHLVCRAFFPRRTTKNFFSSTLRTNEASFFKKTLLCVRNKTHDKDLVCRAFFPDARQSHEFAFLSCARHNKFFYLEVISLGPKSSCSSKKILVTYKSFFNSMHTTCDTSC